MCNACVVNPVNELFEIMHPISLATLRACRATSGSQTRPKFNSGVEPAVKRAMRRDQVTKKMKSTNISPKIDWIRFPGATSDLQIAATTCH